MRKLLRFVLLLVLLVAVAVGVAVYYVDNLAGTGIERGATYALGVPTTVQEADVGLLGGTLRVDRLTVANPEGFKTPHLVAVKRLDLGVETGSLLEETIRVNRFELDGVDLHVEQKVGKSNVSTVLDNIKRGAGAGKPGEPAPEEGEPEAPGGKKIQVDRIVVRNVTAHLQVLPLGGEAATLDVEVPEIILEDVSSDNAEGLAVAELTRRILPAILTAVIKKGHGKLPGMDFDGLAADVGETTAALGKGAQDLVQQVGKGAGGLLEGLFKKPAGTEGEKKEGGGLLDGLLKPKEEGEKKEGGGLLDGLLKPNDEGEKKEGGGLLDGLLKPKDEGEKKEGGDLLDGLFKKDESK